MPVMYYETRPVMVQALQFTGENIEELTEFTGGAAK